MTIEWGRRLAATESKIVRIQRELVGLTPYRIYRNDPLVEFNALKVFVYALLFQLLIFFAHDFF